jgi:2-dehydropantoate 2-reductase
MANPRILVIGAGVNGSAIASALFNGGVDIRILARGKRFEECCSDGIVIENPFSHKRAITRVPVIDHLDPQDIYDYVLVVVRKNQVASLLPPLAQNRSPNIVFLGNNLLGPGEFIRALGSERVMMGGVFAAGKRDGSLIRAIVIKSVASPMGEIEGMITPRLKTLAEILRQGGFKVALSHNIVDTQMTHGVGVALIIALVMKHSGEVRKLARTTEDLKLYVAARREGYRMMRALGHQVIPKTELILSLVPTFLQVVATRVLFNSKMGEVGLQYHISQAPDEMDQLVMELKQLVDQTGMPFPAMRKVLE